MPMLMQKGQLERSMNFRDSETLRVFRKATLWLEFEELEDLASTSVAVFTVVRSRIGDIKEEVKPLLAANLCKEVLSAPIEPIATVEEEGQDKS
jgi:hypothetical protein